MTERAPYVQEAMDAGRLCASNDCPLRSSCARFSDPNRTEQKGIDHTMLVHYSDNRDRCFLLRKQLTGDPVNQRHFQKQAKNHRRRGGKWL
jgi:hypothetical protein